MNFTAQETYGKREEKLDVCSTYFYPETYFTGRISTSPPTPHMTFWDRPSHSWLRSQLSPSGGKTESSYLTSPAIKRVLDTALFVVQSLRATDIGCRAGDFITDLRGLLTTFEQAGIDVGRFPTLGAFVLDDNSLLFEWAFTDFRLGFSIEAEAQESCWYLVTMQPNGGVQASGMIDALDFEEWSRWLLYQVLLRSDRQ
jgi:hypothetical protein